MHPVRRTKIIITGPESSGKTTLAQQLAQHYGAPWVPEFSRDYLNALNRMYREADLVPITLGQLDREAAFGRRGDQLLILDTSLVVMKVWGLYKYGRSHPWITAQAAKIRCDRFFLCAPDNAWTPDPFRENPSDVERWELFELYRKELEQLGFPFTILVGAERERLDVAIFEIEKMKMRSER